jgi:hypothetical protein
MGGDAEREVVVGEDKRDPQPAGLDLKSGPNPYSQSAQVARQSRREAPDAVRFVRLELPQRSLDEWCTNGLVDARPNLPQLITLLKDAYESALRAVRVRADLDWLAGSGRAGDRDAWEGLRERVGELEPAAASDARADPAVVQQIDAFEVALRRGKERLRATVKLLAGPTPPASQSEVDELLDELREELSELRDQSRMVGQTCHEASLRIAAMVCHALDDVMLFVPVAARRAEAPISRRDLPPAEKGSAAEPSETSDRVSFERDAAKDVPAALPRERSKSSDDRLE